MKVYVSGKITGLEPEDYITRFNEAQEFLEAQGYMVMNPASAMAECTAGFSAEEYLHVCYAMIDVCDAVYVLDNWQTSQGARKELRYASDWRKQIVYQDNRTQEPGFPVVHG